ncbi:hypothetical protein Ciccas_000750 [Cichlidogyrus casuarinus]|uniref:Uncharacterized protein n=1 Tax=Cichlidogyrus casuarinus TaxID=1844966 RepID=A0ABD2QM66_9PLAT
MNLTEGLIALKHLILDDDRFYSKSEDSICEDWSSFLLVQCLSNANIPAIHHIEIVKFLVDLTTSGNFHTNAVILNMVLKLIIKIHLSSSDEKVLLASRASIVQVFENFTSQLECKCESCENFVFCSLTAGFEMHRGDVFELLRYVVKNATNLDPLSPNHQSLLNIYLDICNAIISKLPRYVLTYKLFYDYIWQELCPFLGKLLGSLKTMKLKDSIDVVQLPETNVESAKLVYRTAVNLAIWLGPVHSFRPVLESLFQKLLLYSSSEFLYEAIKESRTVSP